MLFVARIETKALAPTQSSLWKAARWASIRPFGPTRPALAFLSERYRG